MFPTDPQPGASRADVSMTPGSVLRLPMKSRPLRPMASIWVAVIVADRSPVKVWTLMVSDWTVTVSATPPTSRLMARSVTRSVEDSTMPVCSLVLKPARVAFKSYVPLSRSVKTKRPSSPVTASRVAFVPVFVMVTVTPGITPPPVSVMVPEIWPVRPCAFRLPTFAHSAASSVVARTMR